MKQRLAGGKIKYCFSKEGVVGRYNSLVTPKVVKNIENAKIFMNWQMAPENMALQSDFAKYANPIMGASSVGPFF